MKPASSASRLRHKRRKCPTARSSATASPDHTCALWPRPADCLVLPPQDDAIEEILDVLDGLLLSGGPDVEPARYGDSAIHAATYGVDPERDQFELRPFAGALRRRLPVFGICRGIQVINVALGGTLIQDVASEHPGAADVGHRQHERGLEDFAVGHLVTTAKPELLPIFEDAGLG